MDIEAGFDQVIGTFYEAATEPELWSAALIGAADLLGGVGGQFFLWNKLQRTAPVTVVGRLPAEGNALYARYYGAIDPRRQAAERLPVGTIMTCDEHFDDGRFRKSEFFNDFLVPFGVPYAAGGRVLETAELSAVITVIRNFHQGPFESREVAVLARLLPHVQRAARLHHRICQMKLRDMAFETAFDRLPFGVVIAHAAGRVLIANRAVEEMAAASDGLILSGARLTADRTDDAAALARLIDEVLQSAARRGGQGSGSLRISRPSGRRPYAVLVAPLSERTTLLADSQAPAALILITDPERQPEVLGRRLVELFGLTAAEARLAAALAEGKRLDEIADERGVRMPTLRTQLRVVLDKTGTTRQVDLVRLIVGLPAIRAPD
jgi:DNA-binding CsgD family transcriptional regulator